MQTQMVWFGFSEKPNRQTENTSTLSHSKELSVNFQTLIFISQVSEQHQNDSAQIKCNLNPTPSKSTRFATTIYAWSFPYLSENDETTCSLSSNPVHRYFLFLFLTFPFSGGYFLIYSEQEEREIRIGWRSTALCLWTDVSYQKDNHFTVRTPICRSLASALWIVLEKDT